jgi:hypothetical protein
MASYFSFDDLLALKAMEKKKLSKVIYHYWQNKTRPEELFEFLDKLELHFGNGESIILTTNEEVEPGIQVARDFDPEKSRLMLLHEFDGKIDMRSEDLTDNPLWEPAVGKTILMVGVVDDGDECFRNDAILLNFGDGEMLEIHPGIEGLIVEPYEEV